MIDFFKTFKSEEISEWINDYLLFLVKPRAVIQKIIKKNKNEKLRQFLFLFIIYTGSFLFLSTGTSISDWIKPAVLNLFATFPLILLFFVATKITSNINKYFGKIFIYIIGFQFVFLPLIIISYTLFLNFENYTYKYISDFLTGFSFMYLIFVSGFAIEKNNVKSLKITLVSYILLNLFYLLFIRIDIDPYNVDSAQKDPIYDEYYDLIAPLKDKEITPYKRYYIVLNDKIETDLVIGDIITSEWRKGTAYENELYLNNLNNNIKHIEESLPQLIFKRNQEIALVWLDYFNCIKREISYQVKDTSEIAELNLTHMGTSQIENSTISIYYGTIDWDGILNNQISLKWYHNSIIGNHQKSTIPSEICNGITLFIAHILDYIIGDLILKEWEPKPYTETFLPLE